MQQNINIPKSLCRRYMTNKRLKELLCFAIWLKMQRENSVVYDIDYKKVRYLCGVGKAKSERLLHDAKEDEDLFTFLGTTIIVSSFRDKTIKKDRFGREYQSAQCFKIPYNKDYKLRDIYNILNRFLATDYINTIERTDCLNCRGAKANKISGASCPMTLKSIAKEIGMSMASAQRIVKDLTNGYILSKSPSTKVTVNLDDKEEVKNVLREYGIGNFTFERKGWGYIVTPCLYSIISRDWTERFQHVIYDYRSHQPAKLTSTIPQLNDY